MTDVQPPAEPRRIRPQRPPGPVLYARTGPDGPRWPEGRYGRRGLERKPNKVVLVVATLVVAFLGAALLTSRVSDLRGAVEAYDVRSDDEVVISLRVDRDPAREVECLVRARGRDGREVGREPVLVAPDPGGNRTRGVRVALPTTARAVSGELLGCRYTTPDPEGDGG